MTRQYRTRSASNAEIKQYKSKALQYKEAMHSAYCAKLWDVVVSNAVHAVMLMANAVTSRQVGKYYSGQDHNQAPEYLSEITGPDASTAARQMALVIKLKGLVEYEARGCGEKEASDVLKRVDRFFKWAEERLPD